MPEYATALRALWSLMEEEGYDTDEIAEMVEEDLNNLCKIKNGWAR